MADNPFTFDLKFDPTVKPAKVPPVIDFANASFIPKKEPVVEVTPDLTAEPVEAMSNALEMLDLEDELKGADQRPVPEDPADESVIAERDPAIQEAKKEAEETEELDELEPLEEPEAVPVQTVDNKLNATNTVIKPTKKITRRKKVEKKEEPKTETVVENKPEAVPVAQEVAVTEEVAKQPQRDFSDFLECQYTPDEMIEKVMSKFSDPKFEKFRVDITERLRKIHISEDTPPGVIRYLLSDLDTLSGDLFQFKVDTRTMYEAITGKIGVFAAGVAMNTEGKSVAEKERNRSLVFLNANWYNEHINLLPVIEAVRYRKIFLEEVEQYMDEKRHAIYSALSNNKTEADIAKLTD